MTVSTCIRGRVLRSVGALVVFASALPSFAEEKPPQSPASGVASWTDHPNLLILYVSVLVVFVIGLHLIDSFQGYSFSRETRDKLLEKLQGRLTPEQMTKLAGELGPTGIQGTTRSILTYALLLILGIAVFHLAAVSKFEQAPAYVDKILTVLAGSLASVIGFYFGTKATAEAGTRGADGSEQPSALSATISGITPDRAAPEETVTIQGTGFGEHPGSVKFGTILATRPKWNPTSIAVKVPSDAPPGKTSVTVNPAHSKEIVGSPELLTVLPGAGDSVAKPAPAEKTKAPSDLATDEGSYEPGSVS